MATHALDGSNRQVDLGDGYSLSAPLVLGVARDTRDASAAARGDDEGTRGFGDDDDTAPVSPSLFDAQLELAGLRRERTLRLDVSGVDAKARAFGAEAEPARIELTVPNLQEEGAIVLVEDEETGALTWHLPRETSAEGARGDGARGLDAIAPRQLTFSITIVAPPPGGERGFDVLGKIGKKLLKVFKFPLEKIEEGVGKIAAGFIRRWEAKHRPYLLCRYDETNYRAKRHDQFALQPADWARLAEGRALLFVHGTFSSCDAFYDLPNALMAELSRAYGGRLFAFNHPTLADDPARNAEFLLSRIPPGVTLDVDIVCHSRGGLVSRELALRGAGGDGARGRMEVARVVLVGVPNAGTALADREHVVHLVDRLSTVANLVPGRATGVIVDALVVVLKCAAQALLGEMDGLRAMDPDGDYITALNGGAGSGSTFHAIVSNFEPKPGTGFFDVTRAADVGADVLVFQQAANDLVVPTLGGWSLQAAGFPVPDERRFEFPTTAGVVHTDYFAQAETQARLREWLAPAAPRDLAVAAERGFTRDELQQLRPHLVNLTDGQLSRRGALATTREDVDALFGTTIPRWLAAQPAGSTPRIVFWAHGGLIGEKDGIAIAAKHVAWWKANGIFPVYFIWETGLFDAIGGLLANAGRAARGTGARDFTDVSDFVVEKAVRALRGDMVWGAMKTNAERASAAGGGAALVAERLAAFARANPRVELHAVGHSAGSIFHAHWLDAAKRRGVPGFRTLQLLAPAIRVDEFRRRIEPLVGGFVGRLTMFSMTDELERRDQCMGVYRKSLLYLIHKALEKREGEPILGLRVSAENDTSTRALFFGDGDGRGPRADAVWSVTSEPGGWHASASRSHGGFDDDGPTMTSVALRVMSPDRAPDEATLRAVRPYVGDARRGREFPLSPEVRLGVAPERVPSLAVPSLVAGRAMADGHAAGRGTLPGRRHALCVGIDAYPAPYTLSGCVGDARLWARLFEETFSFDTVRIVANAEATRQAIVGGLEQLVSRAQPGDTLVFQYSGHGTSLPDVDGDERDDGTDEALVPFDWSESKFLVDDDIRELLAKLPDGVHLTCFIDCCHSGTITRVFGERIPDEPAGAKARRMVLDPASDVVQRYVKERKAEGGARAIGPVDDRTGMRWVNFSACRPEEKAYEQNGNGDFTRIATRLLAQGIDGLTNADFQRRLIEAFGSARRQSPVLDCPPDAEGVPLLQFVAMAAASEAGVAGDEAAHAATPGATDVDLAVPGNVRPGEVGLYDRRAAGGRRTSQRPEGGRRAGDAVDALTMLQEVAEWIVGNHGGQP